MNSAQKKAISASQFALKIGNMVYEALIEEANLTPKPGLVDCANNGAHSDMNIFSFYKSAAALSVYMADFVLLGVQYKNYPAKEILKLIRPLGLLCEKAMFSATHGINTHKGAIFAFGLICVAIGRLFGEKNTYPKTSSICKEVSLICDNIVEKEFNTDSTIGTAGYKIYKAYGLGGARAEAQSGFKTIQTIALPIYTVLTNKNAPKEYCLLLTLLHLLAKNNDTNVISRGGIEGLALVKDQANMILNKHSTSFEEIRNDLIKMDQLLIKKNISPGGSADLLAVTYFFSNIENIRSKLL